jgi:uncharacterized protein
MTADDLSAPLGRQPAKRRRRLPITGPQAIVGALALFFAVFVVWAIVGDDPFGGEPMVAVPIQTHIAAATKKPVAPEAKAVAGAANTVHDEGASPPPKQAAAPPTKTVTIIDGKTGARQEVAIPDTANGASQPESGAGGAAGQKYVEITSHGAIPKIAADGTRPAEAFARPVKPLAGKPDAPRIAIIVSGLGVSAKASSDAIVKLPGAVTLAFMPYADGVDRLVAHAREVGHEVLLQVPMEPFDYPDNDPGPKTLLTSLTPEQNIDRLYWLMSRFQGYVGIAGDMGARFTASEQSFAPILRETAKRGLIFVDDGANPRSVAGRIAGATNLPFAKADMVLDSVPTPTEIDQALGRLEMAAREHGVAVGVASALPVSLDHIALWAKTAESNGFLLVPITAVALKGKQI